MIVLIKLPKSENVMKNNLSAWVGRFTERKFIFYLIRYYATLWKHVLLFAVTRNILVSKWIWIN